MRMRSISVLAVAALLAACGAGGRSPTSPPALAAQTFNADSSCAGGCAGGVLAYTGSFTSGVHYLNLGSVQDGLRVFLHTNVLTGDGNVQIVLSTDCSTWTSYDPVTELSGTSTTLGSSFTGMGFDTPPARCVGVRNTSPMDAYVLLWAFGI